MHFSQVVRAHSSDWFFGQAASAEDSELHRAFRFEQPVWRRRPLIPGCSLHPAE
jgi:hypothetical protein